MFSTYRNDGFALQSVKKKEIRKINVEELNKTDGYMFAGCYFQLELDIWGKDIRAEYFCCIAFISNQQVITESLLTVTP